MSLIDALRYRLRTLLRRDAFDRELDDEIQHHLDLEALEARSSAGAPISDDDARLRARRQFGNVTYSNEERRMITGIAVIDSARQDVQFVLRLLRRRAAFAAVVVATIAIGIGAATSIFSVADTVLFRPLAFRDPERLITVWAVRPQWKTIAGLAARWDRGVISLPVFRDWRAAQRSFDDVAVWVSDATVAGDADARQDVTVVRASASLLRVLGTRPEIGSWFTPDDDVVGGAPVALLSHETWTARFGGDPRVLGRTVRIDSSQYTIVGVMPPGVTIDRNGATPAYWVPAGRDPASANDRGWTRFQAIGRLKSGVPLSAAAAESDQLFRASSDDKRVKGARLATLHDDQTRDVRRPLLILLAASALLLLIACINVATLLVGEAANREHELRTRRALGAGRGRLLRQLLTESSVLAGMGAVFGIALAYGGTTLIVRWAPAGIPGLADVRVDARVLAVALLAAGVTGVLFGLAPALSLTRSSSTLADRLGGRVTRGRGRGQRVLIACEVALSMVLLVSAGLLVRSLDKMSAVGFRPSELLVLRVSVPQSSDSLQVRALYRGLVDRLMALPGVSGVAATTMPPFGGGLSTSSFEVEGQVLRTGSPQPEAHRRVTTPEFFVTMGIPIVAGRAYTATDAADAPPVVVVSRALARREWPADTAVGKRIKLFGKWRTVIGVAGDIETERPSADAPEVVYAPLAQLVRGSPPALVVRTRANAADAVPAIQSAIRDVAADVTLIRADHMSDLVAAALADDRLRTVLISLFAAIAALLGAVGTYGVAATAASRRMREMAIRVAVGASHGSIARLIIGGAAAGVAAGAIAGVLLARLSAHALSPYLYGVGPFDPTAYAGVVVLLAVTTIVATWVPARRATRVRLVETLRSE